MQREEVAQRPAVRSLATVESEQSADRVRVVAKLGGELGIVGECPREPVVGGLDLADAPGLVEEGLEWAVQPEDGEEPLTRHRLDPVPFGHAGRLFGSEVHGGRPVRRSPWPPGMDTTGSPHGETVVG